MKNYNFIAIAPFRLDLVMGGVSDLDWWKEKEGDCLSISCNFQNTPIQIEAMETNDSYFTLCGFSEVNKSFIMPCEHLALENFKSYPKDMHLVLAALIVASEILKVKIENLTCSGMKIVNKSCRMKGMGGSSAVAASLISLVCYVLGKVNLELQEVVDNVSRVESIAEIGGGWEDVVGIYNPGVNWVQSRPQNNPQLSIVKIPCNEVAFNNLSRDLLVVDSRVKASTAQILSSAEKTYMNNPQLVIENTNKIRSECQVVCDSLIKYDQYVIGESLTRQRNYWNIITGGISANPDVDEMVSKISSSVIGYREAGAGGGGTVLVMCFPNQSESAANELQKLGFDVKLWNVSDYGLNVEMRGYEQSWNF